MHGIFVKENNHFKKLMKTHWNKNLNIEKEEFEFGFRNVSDMIILNLFYENSDGEIV